VTLNIKLIYFYKKVGIILRFKKRFLHLKIYLKSFVLIRTLRNIFKQYQILVIKIIILCLIYLIQNIIFEKYFEFLSIVIYHNIHI